jgi:hypothetical protein
MSVFIKGQLGYEIFPEISRLATAATCGYLATRLVNSLSKLRFAHGMSPEAGACFQVAATVAGRVIQFWVKKSSLEGETRKNLKAYVALCGGGLAAYGILKTGTPLPLTLAATAVNSLAVHLLVMLGYLSANALSSHR